MTPTFPSRLGLALLVITLAAAPAAADWLVMVDGTRVETDGPWSQRGKLVVFTDTSGNFVSLRLDDVDLEASREATEAAEAAARRPAPAPAPAPRRESVMRLTDEDVGHIDDFEVGAPVEQEPAAETGEQPSEEPAASAAVEVAAWERETTPGGDGIMVRATLENPNGDAAVGISVGVTLYDEEGEILATAPGRLAASGLMPGQRTELVATFPGVFDFAAVDFDIDHRALSTRSAGEAPSVESDASVEQEVDDGTELEEFDESG